MTSTGRLAESNRVEAFSDGVFAIALTLLVLDLHAPENERGEFARALVAQWPAYAAYMAAFLNISAIWINHHDLFTRVSRVDPRLVVTNLALLFVASLFPWPASVISSAVREGDRADQLTATLLYAGVGFLVPLAWILVYRYLGHHSELLVGAHETDYMWKGVRRSLLSVVAYPIAALVALASPLTAILIFVLLPLFFIITLFTPRPLTDTP